MKAQKPRDVKKFLLSIGWEFLRSGKGSHEIWGLADESVKVSLPMGHKEISAGVLKQIERAGVDVPQSWK